MQFRKLEALGVLKLFDFVVSSEEAGYEKPDKVLFMLCVSKSGCDASECLYVGDNLKSDILAAERAGLRAAWFVPDKKPLPDGAPLPVDHIGRQEADGSVLCFSEYEELPDLIRKIQI